MPPNDTAATPPVVATVEPIAHSNWKNRVVYVAAVTAALVIALFYAIAVDRHVDVVAWLMATMFVLFLIAPSAEQAVKMLATLAALRAGVAFSSSAEVDQTRGTASSQTSAIPAQPATLGD